MAVSFTYCDFLQAVENLRCRLTAMSQLRTSTLKKDTWEGDDFEVGQMILFGLTSYNFYSTGSNCYTDAEAKIMIDRANAFAMDCCRTPEPCNEPLNVVLATEDLIYLVQENGYFIFI